MDVAPAGGDVQGGGVGEKAVGAKVDLRQIVGKGLHDGEEDADDLELHELAPRQMDGGGEL